MNVTKNAWHFKLAKKHYKWCDEKEYPVSLCSYFWHVMWALAVKFVVLPLFIVMGALICGLIVWGVIMTPHQIFSLVLNHFLPDYFQAPTNAFWGDFGTLQLWIVDAVFYALVTLFLWVRFKVKNRKRKPYSTRKEDSLVVAWVKAKKNKVCPLVEYKD